MKLEPFATSRPCVQHQAQPRLLIPFELGITVPLGLIFDANMLHEKKEEKGDLYCYPYHAHHHPLAMISLSPLSPCSMRLHTST